MTFDAMRQELDRLRGLRFRPADYQTHWEGLQEMPLSALAAAVGRAAKQCQDFPTPAELRALADAVGPSVVVLEDRSTPLAAPVVVTAPFLSKPITVAREWKYYDERCSDLGWMSYWCGDPASAKPWIEAVLCGRLVEHPPHEWVERCRCADSNPAVLHRRERDARYAANRGEYGRRAS